MDKNELPARILSDRALLFHDDVPPVVLRTFARLYALAWKHRYDRTDRLTTDELLVLLNLPMRSLYRYLAALRELGVLEWASDGKHGYIFTFPKNYGVPLADDAVNPGTGAEIGSTDFDDLDDFDELSRAELAEVGPTIPEPITAKTSSPTAKVGSPAARNSSPTAKVGSSAAKNSSQKHPVVVDHLYPDQDMNKQQQHRENRGSPTASGLWPEPTTARIGSPTAKTDSRVAARRRRRPVGGQYRSWPELEAALTQAGMWHDQAQGLTARLDVDGVLDALGWIAAVRADRRVRNHGAVLVKQLQAARRAPADWRPAAVCARCGVVESRCGCGGRRRVVPAVYYTAAIEPVRAWGCDAWGVCQTCGRVSCAGHDPVGEGDVGEAEIYRGASNGTGGAENSSESRIRRAWPEVAEFIRQCYHTEIKLLEIGVYEVKVTFAGDERSAVVNRVRSMLKRAVRGFVEVIDAGPV